MNASNEDDVEASYEELLGRRDSWTLACDNLLLNRLKRFSKELEKQCTSLAGDFKSLNEDVTVLNAKLGNVTNEFHALSNTQFVENRVQEFDISGPQAQNEGSEVSTSSVAAKAEKEAKLMKKMKEAIQLGLKAETERSKITSEMVANYALPYTIGTPKFFSSRYVGLVDETGRMNRRKDELGESIASQGSIPRSYEDNVVAAPYSNTKEHSIPFQSKPSVKENAVPAWMPNETLMPSKPGPRQEEYRNGVVTTPSTVEHNRPLVQEPTSMQPQSSVIPQGTNQNAFKSTLSNKLNSRQPYLFDEPPPITDDDDDEEPIIDTRDPRKGGLFCDEDEDDDDIFNDKSLFSARDLPNPFSANKYPNLTNSFAGRTSPPALVPGEPKTAENRTSKQFDDSVGSVPKAENSASSVSASAKNEDAVRENGTSNPQVFKKGKIPPGGVSIFGSVPPAQIPKLPTQQQTSKHEAETVSVSPGNTSQKVSVSDERRSNEDRESTGTSHSSLTSRGFTSSQEGSLNETIPNKLQPTSKQLFHEDSDEDLFSTKKTSKPTTVSRSDVLSPNERPKLNQTTRKTNTSSKLNTTSKIVKTSIFDDSSSDDDLFSSTSSNASKIQDLKATKTLQFPGAVAGETDNIRRKPGFKGSSLFDDSDSDSGSGLFGNSSQPNTNTIDKDKSNAQVSATAQSSQPSSKSNSTGSKVKANVNPSALIRSSPSPLYSKSKSNMEKSEGNPPVDGVVNEGVEPESLTTESVSVNNTARVAEEITRRDSDLRGEITAIEDSIEVIDNNDISEEMKLKEAVGLVLDKTEDLLDNCSAISSNERDNPLEKPESGSNGNTNASKIAKLKEKLSADKPPQTAVQPRRGSDSKVENSKISMLKGKLADADSKRTTEKVAVTSGIGKPKVDVKKLALGLKINPLAMMPGSKPVKQGSVETPESPLPIEPLSTPAESPTVSGPATPSPGTPASTPVDNKCEVFECGRDKSHSKSPSPENEKGPEESPPAKLLPNLGKGRPKIQAKRRPPSKQLLHSYGSTRNDGLEQGSEEQIEKSELLENKCNDNDVPNSSEKLAEKEQVAELEKTAEPEKENAEIPATLTQLADPIKDQSKTTDTFVWEEEVEEPPPLDLDDMHQPGLNDDFEIRNVAADVDILEETAAPVFNTYVGAQPLFASEPPQTTSKGVLPPDDDSDDDIFKSSLVKKKDSQGLLHPPAVDTPPLVETLPSKPAVKVGKSQERKGLFDSDSDSEDLFASKKAGKSTLQHDESKPNVTKTDKKKASKIFDDSSDEDLFAVKPKS